MFKKLLLISLACMCVMAFMPSQASAGCTPPSPKWCCSCLPGSLDCLGSLLGVGNVGNLCADSEVDCPVGFIGIYPPDVKQGKKYVYDPSCAAFDAHHPETIPEDCFSVVSVECQYPPGKKEWKHPKGTATSFQSYQPWISGTMLATCVRNGRCDFPAPFALDEAEDYCNNNFESLQARVYQYFLYAEACDGGVQCPPGSTMGTGDDAGRCFSGGTEVFDGRVCCQAQEDATQLADGSYNCGTNNLNDGKINSDTTLDWTSGGFDIVMEICTYVPDETVENPDGTTTFIEEHYDCSPCTPKDHTGTKVTAWNCPNPS